ncbi:phage distal tail protein, Rcc01695 family [Thalassobius sp. S69A]|uniref:phage distal tail protein, Rcc01695 family n=1 Tax=unclassified Thalassovita TaxID=2619711 RepID=UPI000C107AE3|nr:glycoside hydrolase family 24 [Paracoccaceae bacterium]MBT25355.1 glycoside hydrolase family 24 [Paracoccaceae bacterium]
MQFHEVRFPANLSFGAVGGPERRTEIVTLVNGHEERNTPWAHSRRHYDAGMGMRSLDDVETLIGFFEARQGQMFGFRWKDWSDFKSCLPSAEIGFADQVIALGDGETLAFQLTKTYRSGSYTYARPIKKPVLGTVRMGIEGDEQKEGVHYWVDVTTGMVTFAAPPNEGDEITAGYEFDVPVRFDTDRIRSSVASFQAGEVPDVPVIEVRA